MSKEALHAEIDEKIYENLEGDISGEVLNEVLNDIVDEIPEDTGTDVEANPEDEATDTLEKIKIDGLVYEIPESGGPSVTYVHFMYSENQPTQDTDIHPILSENDKYIGIYVGPLGPPPQNYNQYQWAKFVGDNGQNGLTPYIDPTTKHWMIGLTDTGIVAEGQNGQNGAPGQNGENGVTPHIDPTTKHWMIGLTDTGIVAEGQDGQNGTNGITPSINPSNKHWMIGETDTGIVAEGQDGTNGTNGTNGTDAYVHIKYSQNQPTQDSDMHASPQIGDKYIGVYSGTSSTAPTAYTSYTWSKYVGENGANGANGQSIKYINLNDAEDLPEPSATYSNIVALAPSTTQQGIVDQYACIENAVVGGQTISGWSWVYMGSTSPIVSVQEVDVYANLVEWYRLDGYVARGSNGGFASTANAHASIYEVNTNEAYLTFAQGNSGVVVAVVYYDDTLDMSAISSSDNPAYISSAYGIDTSMAEPKEYVMERVTLPPNTKYVAINWFNSSRTIHGAAEKTNINQALVKGMATAGDINYFTVEVSDPLGDSSQSTEITDIPYQSAAAIIFPQSYSNIGKPTQVIAMLHGSDGVVSPSVLGYSNSNWLAWQNLYLGAGFAVMDINGYGVSSANDQKSMPWGNPQSVETFIKAWEYVKTRWNVNDKILLHGNSMGGVTAYSILMNHPDIVLGVGLFAPACLPYEMKFVWQTASHVCAAWGYVDEAAAEADGYSKFIGFSPLMESEYDWSSNDLTQQAFAAMDAKTILPNVPIRIWQGSADTVVPPQMNQLIVSALRRANIDATLRIIPDATHSLTQSSIARNEAVSWFKRFVNV